MFSQEWDRQYRAGAHLSVWPFSDLISLVMRNTPTDRKRLRVLELGVGAGANVPFFIALGCDYVGVDGSDVVVQQLRGRFPEHSGCFVVADFSRPVPLDGLFDLIFDRAAVSHNDSTAIAAVLAWVSNKLTPNGIYVGVDWYSSECTEYREGTPGEDPYTRNGYDSGRFARVGTVHFSTEQHLLDLFREFEFLTLEHKTVISLVPGGNKFGAFNFVCRPRLR
jgi:hypothetical protein